VAEPGAGRRIARVELHPYAIPLSRPWKCARGDTLMRRGWLVRIEDSDGAHGWGETAGLPGAGTEIEDPSERGVQRVSLDEDRKGTSS